MNAKNLLIAIVAVAFFTLVASHRFHDSAHALGMIRKGGGMARHPALLDKDRDSYILIATAGVIPPYSGNAHVVLEGDPTLKATFYNSGPALDLGLHRHPKFKNNTYYGLQPRDKVALWVKIERDHSIPAGKPPATTAQQSSGRAPDCAQCEAEEPANTAPRADHSDNKPHTPSSTPVMRTTIPPGGAAPPTEASNGKAASRWQGHSRNDTPSTGPAVAFYDVETKQRLLRIPIRFIGDKGAEGDEH